MKRLTQFTCPVCYFDRLDTAAERYAICPCCGTEFGYHDFALSDYEVELRRNELRAAWRSGGADFWDDEEIPDDWATYRLALLRKHPTPISIVDDIAPSEPDRRMQR